MHNFYGEHFIGKTSTIKFLVINRDKLACNIVKGSRGSSENDGVLAISIVICL